MKKFTYVNECLKNGKLVRWPDSVRVLTFYIAPFRWYASKGQDYKYKAMVKQALDVWTKALNGKITFELVNTLNESQINLDWKRVERKSLGHCYYNFDHSGRLFSAEVEIGLSDGVIHSQYMDENEVYHTIVHEIGHALGLGHSPFKKDIMYVPHQYGVTQVTTSDTMTLQWLYKLPFGKTTDEILSSYNAKGISDIDGLIVNLMEGKTQSKFEEMRKNMPREKHRDLNEERDMLAQINKTNIAYQNINFSPEFIAQMNELKKPKDQ